MAAQPTILLITADVPAGYLTALATEVNEIQRTLNSVPGRQYEVVALQQATAEDVIREFNVPGRVIEVIHYAGHADSSHLFLADGSAAAEALAEKIRLAGTVKLVFLNGCATQKLVDFFHATGTPLFIGTVRKVGDEQASWVARQFYGYLANRRPVRNAMKETVADAHLARRHRFASADGVVRTLVTRDIIDEESAEDFAWGLRPNPGSDEPEDYALPIRPVEMAATTIPIRHFLEGLILALRESGHPRLAPVRELAGLIDRGSDVSEEAMKEKLSSLLPFTLCVRLQQILAKPGILGVEYYRELIYDYAVFFETLLHHAASILLAQAWDKKLKPPAKGRKVIKEYLQQNRLEASPETYLPLVEYSSDWLGGALGRDSVAFVRPLLDYMKSDSFREAADFFFLQKRSYHQKLRLHEADVINNCVHAQDYILQAMPCFRFLVENLMASIRDIDVRNLRYLGFTEFDNIFYLLAGDKANRLTRPGSAMSENKSILYFQGESFEVGVESLNLFPFIFDRNVFTDKTSEEVDLYVFCGYFPPAGKTHDCYHFFSVRSPGKVWRFDEKEREASLLHIDDPEASPVHKANNLMMKTGELRQYLSLFKQFFIE